MNKLRQGTRKDYQFFITEEGYRQCKRVRGRVKRKPFQRGKKLKIEIRQKDDRRY